MCHETIDCSTDEGQQEVLAGDEGSQPAAASGADAAPEDAYDGRERIDPVDEAEEEEVMH